MRRAKDVIGLTILSLSSGRKLGSVKDVLFDPETNRILAVLVDEGGWFDKARVVPFGSIRSFGRDAVIVPDDTVVVPADSDPVIKRALDRGKVVVGMEVYTTDGRYLGKIDEVVFDEQTGQVQGFEVSGGLVAETLRGKHFVSAAETRATGLQVAFVPPETGTRVEREVTGGLAAAAEEAYARALGLEPRRGWLGRGRRGGPPSQQRAASPTSARTRGRSPCCGPATRAARGPTRRARCRPRR